MGWWEQIKGKSDLVGGWATPLKNMKVSWDDDIPNIWENKIFPESRKSEINLSSDCHFLNLYLILFSEQSINYLFLGDGEYQLLSMHQYV